MNNWLHFIGGKYYTISKFEKEAFAFGVSRRIDVRLAKQMQFGDKVYLFQKSGKSSILFGYFVIDGLYGAIPEKVKEELKAEGKLREMENKGGMPAKISRGCGTYFVGAVYQCTASLSELCEKVAEHGGKDMMIAGKYHNTTPVRSAITFQRGFRAFDYEGFVTELKGLVQDRRKRIVVQGHWYMENEKSTVVNEEGRLVHINDYKRIEEIKKEEPKQTKLFNK